MLLDVDGVVLLHHDQRPENLQDQPTRQLLPYDGHEWVIPEAKEKIAALATVADLAWCTLRHAWAPRVLGPYLGVGDLVTAEISCSKSWFQQTLHGDDERIAKPQSLGILDRPTLWIEDGWPEATHRWAKKQTQPLIFMDASEAGLTWTLVSCALGLLRDLTANIPEPILFL